MRTLEEYFRDNAGNNIIDFSVRATVDVENKQVKFYIHPTGVNGDTMDFEVWQNDLRTLCDLR